VIGSEHRANWCGEILEHALPGFGVLRSLRLSLRASL
jgi:hypothetical protein